MSNSNQMRELAGLVDNVYLSSKNRMDTPATPQRHRTKKHPQSTPRAEPSRTSNLRRNSENVPHSRAGPAAVPKSPARGPLPRSKSRASPVQVPQEKKRFNATLSKPTGGSSLTGKRWNLSCFTMGKPIGKGRFGNVYLAREKASMKVLALKIMLKKDLEAAGVYHQVKSEIDIHVNYGSGCPNIVRCYGYFYDEKRIFIVMEYARKGELYRTMKAQPGGRFSEEVAARYIYQLVRALKYLHGLNVIHRDIKPENLLLDKAGNLRLCDFGWSIEVADYDMRQTICGTQSIYDRTTPKCLLRTESQDLEPTCIEQADYLAPEMLMERPYTTSVDLWAAGVVTYEFLLGRSPFRSESAGADTLSRIQRGSYEFPDEPMVSTEAKDFVGKLLQVEPGDRMTLAQAVEHPWLWPQVALQVTPRT